MQHYEIVKNWANIPTLDTQTNRDKRQEFYLDQLPGI